MVWAGISMDGKTDLYVLPQGTMTAVRYRDEVLDVFVRPYAGAVGENFILMDDNAPPHRARIIDQYLEDETIIRMDWPAPSPDLNPIEHVWDMLQRGIASRQQHPQTVGQLQVMLQQEWAALDQASVRRLIQSMRRRCMAVITARGSQTRY